MKRLSRTHENIVTAMRGVETKGRRHLLEIVNDIISLFFGRAMVPLRGAFDVDAVLVRSREKESLDPLLPLPAGNRIRHDHRVEMTKMRETVGVVDGRADGE